MRSLLPKIIVIASAVVLCTAIAGLGEDYLVIKKKGGPTQKVPLNFAPDQIESFQVESTPGAPSGKAAPATPGVEQTQRPKEVQGETQGTQPEGKPLEIRPGAPSASPSILRRGPGGAPPSSGGTGQAVTEEDTETEIEQPPAGPKPSERPPSREPAPAPPRKPVAGPVSAALPGGKGAFSVNVYKLP